MSGMQADRASLACRYFPRLRPWRCQSHGAPVHPGRLPQMQEKWEVIKWPPGMPASTDHTSCSEPPCASPAWIETPGGKLYA